MSCKSGGSSNKKNQAGASPPTPLSGSSSKQKSAQSNEVFKREKLIANSQIKKENLRLSERLCKMVQNDPKKAALILEQWIKEGIEQKKNFEKQTPKKVTKKVA